MHADSHTHNVYMYFGVFPSSYDGRRVKTNWKQQQSLSIPKQNQSYSRVNVKYNNYYYLFFGRYSSLQLPCIVNTRAHTHTQQERKHIATIMIFTNINI